MCIRDRGLSARRSRLPQLDPAIGAAARDRDDELRSEPLAGTGEQAAALAEGDAEGVRAAAAEAEAAAGDRLLHHAGPRPAAAGAGAGAGTAEPHLDPGAQHDLARAGDPGGPVAAHADAHRVALGGDPVERQGRRHARVAATEQLVLAGADVERVDADLGAAAADDREARVEAVRFTRAFV